MTHPGPTRRQALAGVAVGGLSLPVLGACGGGSSTTSAGGGQPSSRSGSKSPTGSGGGHSQAQVLVAANDVPVGGGVILASANVVVTRPDKGTYEGFSATCTHQGCLLASVAGGTINCGCHGSQFSITDGSNVTGPLGSAAGSIPALPRVSVKVQGGDVVKG